MVIRTFQRKKKIKKIIITLFAIIIWAFFIARISDNIYSSIIRNRDNTYKIGTATSIIGTISIENNFPLYTHKITDKHWKIFFLKSSLFNLNNYTGNIEIRGTIKDIKKSTPIIDVEIIKLIDQWLIIKNNTYFFLKDMIYIDFSNQQTLSAKKNEKEIEIWYANEKLFSIERFLCNRVLRQRDCNYLIEDYNDTQKENFDSYRWYTYYKHGTWLRTVFDGTMFWYIFKNIEEEMILNTSSIIRIVDKDFILDNKTKEIKQACQEKNKDTREIHWSLLEYENNDKISLIIDNHSTGKRCKVTFDMRNERKITETKIIN